MSTRVHACLDCGSGSIDRRQFLRRTAVGTAAAVTAAVGADSWGGIERAGATPESTVKQLYDSLTDQQRNEICFAWDFQDAKLGLLRARVGANWHITKPAINSDFFTVEQRRLIRDIFEGIIVPEWHERFDQQLKDDTGGFGNGQNIAIFGTPGSGKFEFVLTGRHMTLRCDGDSAEHVAFGGPIFYGHAASGATEKPDHPGNIFWEQALAANSVYQMLDGKQRAVAEVAKSPPQQKVGFQGTDGEFPGIPVSELSADQRAQVQTALKKLIAPYRHSDRDEVVACLDAQGGLDRCHLAFYTDADLGRDRVWDNWRLEGPSFAWYFRGAPHVHVWVHVADDPSVKLNA
jgi:hypothetical protein